MPDNADRSSPSWAQWLIYVLDLPSFFLYKSVHSSEFGCTFLRYSTTFFAPFRHLIAPVLHPKNGFHPQTKIRPLACPGSSAWAVEAEREIDRGESPRKSRISKLTTFGDLIDLRIADIKEVGKALGRSKDATLGMLKRMLGKLNMVVLDRDRLISFGKMRAAEGAGPMTLSIDIGMAKLVLQHAAAIHGLGVSVKAVELATGHPAQEPGPRGR